MRWGSVPPWKPHKGRVSKRMSRCAECCREARESRDREPIPRIGIMEVTGGLDVSDFQGRVGLSENGRKKSRENVTGNNF